MRPAAERNIPEGNLELAETGTASFYGDPLQGRGTSNGASFDNGKLTGAHHAYPFGSKVRVTNIATGRSVIVIINDRIPKSGRIVNVSRRAAEELGFVSAGTASVRLELVRDDIVASGK